MGGGNEPSNIVELTGEEHYVAHQLLVRIHSKHERLVHAAIMMAKRCNGSKAYGWLRRHHAAYQTLVMRGNNYALGNKLPPLTPEHRAIIVAFNTGKVLSPESRAKISEANSGKPMPAQTRAALAMANTGKVPTAEHREKIAASKRGEKRAPFSQEWRNNMAARQRGVTPSVETREKIAAAHRGMKHSEATKTKLSAIRRARISRNQELVDG